MQSEKQKVRAQLAAGCLNACGVALGADFDSLRSSTVESLLAWADHYHYRKPKNANGSRGRYFHDMLQRRARSYHPA